VSRQVSPYFDVVVASDIYVLGGTNSVLAAYADYLASIGARLAVLPMHLPHATDRRPVYSRIRERINSGSIFVIEDRPQHIACGLFIVDNPGLMHTPGLDPKVRIESGRRIIIVPFPPEDGRGLTYDPMHVLNMAGRISRGAYVWAPVSPLVRGELARLYPFLPLTRSDVRPILDPAAYAPRRGDWPTDRIAVGRHSRPHAEKWPSGRAAFLRVYPADPAVDIRFLGIRPDQLRRLIGEIPANYRLYGYNEIGVAEFLRELDFFVYYNNSWWVEALGIVVLEAMLARVPCVLPAYMRANFGAHAIYAGPGKVWQTIARRLEQPEGLRALVDGAHEFAATTYSREAFAGWLAEIGFAPAARSQPVAVSVDSCWIIDLRGNGVLELMTLERVASAIERGERCVILREAEAEPSAYARAFLRERAIPLLDASPNLRIEAKKVFMVDPFKPEMASLLLRVDAGEVEIHINWAPDFDAPDVFSVIAGQKNLRLRTGSRPARIWAESQAINHRIGDLEKPVLTARTVAACRARGGPGRVRTGVFCEGGGEEIERRLGEIANGRAVAISVHDSQRRQAPRPNVLRWLRGLSSLFVIANGEELEAESHFVLLAAGRIGIPARLIAHDDSRGLASIASAARLAADG